MAGREQFLELSFASGESSLSVRRFLVREALSGLFEVSVVARSHDHAIDLEKIAGKAAGLAVHTGFAHVGAPKRLWTGVCSHFEQVQVEVSQKGESTYAIRIVPDLWLLTHRTGNRIFQRKTLPEIVQAVLGEWKITPQLLLNKKYLPHDYVVQYDETDFAFVCRLLERAGITYYFTFSDADRTVLTLSDEPHHGKERGGEPVPWIDNPNREAEKEFVTRVHVGQGVRPGKFTVREFDFRKKPDFPYFSKAKPADAPEDFYEQYHYLPADTLRINPPDGGNGATPVADDRGKVRSSQNELDARAARGLLSARRTRREVTFQSNCVDLAPGLVFSIGHHPRSDLKPGEKLLLTEYTLDCVVNEQWTFSGTAVYAKNEYQPDQKTPAPRIAGVQSAMVVGPAGKEIHTDEFGRVRVQFHWDREGKFNDESSCWIRVSQQWAGSAFGTQFIPRVGHEVLVGYLEGDPDKPVVVGRVYDNVNRVPHKLPEHKTRSTWKSDSSPHTGGYNEILFEDKKGEELFYVQAELDLQKLTKREEVERTYQNRTTIVGKDRTVLVKSVDATMVGGTWIQQMIAPPGEGDLKILKQEVPSVSPRATTTEMKSRRLIFTTGEATVAFDDDNIVFEASGDIVIHAHGKNAIFEGSHTYLNSRSPASAPSPSSAGTAKPGTFNSVEADKRGILNPFQAARAELKYQALSPAQKQKFEALLAKAGSKDEEAYLQKALAAGRSVDEIAAFADRIRGQSPTWLQDNLKLTGSSTGTGVQQQFSMSCNATVVQAVHGELDPIYSLQVHDANPKLDQADNRNPTKLNPGLAAEQKAILESPYAGAVSPGLVGQAGVATARSGTGGVGRFADDKLNELSPTTGLGFQTQLVGKDVTSQQLMTNLDSSLAQGAPVPIIIGQSTSNTAHYVLVTGTTDGPPKSYTIHDPWEGKTVTRTADQMQNGNLDIAGHSHIAGIEKPTIL